MSGPQPSPVTPIWRPSPERIERTVLTRYMRWLRDERGLDFAAYESLWRWSVDEIEAFWASIWTFCGMRSTTPYREVLHARTMPGARWFDGATVNYADQMLWRASDPNWATRPAVVFSSERVTRHETSWGELAAQVQLADMLIEDADEVGGAVGHGRVDAQRAGLHRIPVALQRAAVAPLVVHIACLGDGDQLAQHLDVHRTGLFRQVSGKALLDRLIPGSQSLGGVLG